MIQEGLIEEGFKTLKGIVDVTYYSKGYAFQTPEVHTRSINLPIMVHDKFWFST
jgi:hypothetical protein